MIRKSLAIVATFAFITILFPSPAHAGLRWEGDHPVVLVYAPVPTSWGVGKAVTQWNKSGAITLQMSAQPCTGCITVEEATTPDASGSAELHHIPGQSTFLHCRIRLDPLYRDIGLGAHGIAAHELGHCLGLPHTRGIWSVMNPESVHWLDRPSPADLRRVDRLYAHAHGA